MDVDCGQELGKVVKEAEWNRKHANGVAKAEYSTALDVEVDVGVGDFNSVNDLTRVEVGNANSVVGVGVRVWTYGVGTTGTEVVVKSRATA